MASSFNRCAVVFRKALTRPNNARFRYFSSKEHDNIKKSISVGKKAIDFECMAYMPDGSFKKLSLNDYKGKYLVLFFYPLNFTFVCPTEITSFSDRASEFNKVGASILAASCDSQFSHKAWASMDRSEGGIKGLSFPVIADLTKSISREYQVLDEEKGFPLRGLFIIDKKGVLRHMSINDTSVGRSVDEVLRLVQAFLFTDENPGVCPINWKPGTPVIDPKNMHDYFSKHAK